MDYQELGITALEPVIFCWVQPTVQMKFQFYPYWMFVVAAPML